MEAEDLGAIVADHKALQLLLVHGEGAGFDVEVASSREAQHVLTLGVPGHAVGIWFLTGRNGGDPVTWALALFLHSVRFSFYSLNRTELLTVG